jgi:hypothetical protein
VAARFSALVQTGPGAHPASCPMGTWSFPGVKRGRGVTLTPHPLLVPLVMKEYSYTSTPSMGRTACTEPQCLYKDALYLFFYNCKYDVSDSLSGVFQNFILLRYFALLLGVCYLKFRYNVLDSSSRVIGKMKNTYDHRQTKTKHKISEERVHIFT